jgi:adenine phosphoribosyltransferase
MNLKDHITEVPDFPVAGVSFKDITPLLAHGGAMRNAAVQLNAVTAEMLDHAGPDQTVRKLDLVLGAEARGFLFGVSLANHLGAGFVPMRKANGLMPRRCQSYDYETEYGRAVLRVHDDSIRSGDRVLVHDDLLATGGTAHAMAELAESMGATVVGYSFLVELTGLGGRSLLGAHRPVCSVLTYEH